MFHQVDMGCQMVRRLRLPYHRSIAEAKPTTSSEGTALLLSLMAGLANHDGRGSAGADPLTAIYSELTTGHVCTFELGPMSENEVEVGSPPTDGVTALRFSPDGRTFAATSWDSVLRIYSVASADAVAKLPQPAPLLDCDFLGCDRVLSAASDGGLRLHEWQSGVERVLGRHASGIRCVRRCAAIGATVTGSWDRSIKLWDERAAEACIGTYAQPDKVFAMCKDAQGAPAPSVPLLVVATASRHVNILDLRKPSEPLQRRESALKCQTRAVAQMPSGLGYAMGSVEGRVAIEYFDPDAAAQEKRYAFKCHRTAVGGGRERGASDHYGCLLRCARNVTARWNTWAAHVFIGGHDSPALRRFLPLFCAQVSTPPSPSTPFATTRHGAHLRQVAATESSTCGTVPKRSGSASSRDIARRYRRSTFPQTARTWPSRLPTPLSAGRGSTRRMRFICVGSPTPT